MTTTTTIQPPPVTITPAPVIIDAIGVDASQVRSKLVIIGGDGSEENGDTVIYENENSTTPETGQLVQRTEPKMEETGEDRLTATRSSRRRPIDTGTPRPRPTSASRAPASASTRPPA